MRPLLSLFVLMAFSSAHAADFLAADGKLNELCRVYMMKLDQKQTRQFVAAQSAWVKFKDLDCSFQSSGVDGGTAQSEVIAACLADRTNTRIKQIEYLLMCQEGDLSCPAW